MKLIIIKDNLRNGLLIVERAMGENKNLPILKNVRIGADANKITLCATNLEIATTATVAGKVIEHGAVSVPLGIFLDLINNLQTDRLNLETKNTTLNIKTDNYEATIQGMPPEEFPIIPKIKNSDERIEVRGEILKDALNQVVLSTQFSELRPELNSVLFHFSLENLKIAATDSFRLSEKTIQNTHLKTTNPSEFKLLIPLKTATELIRILGDDDVVEIRRDPSQILFTTPRFEFISRLVDGNFPDYAAIVPQKFTTEIVVKHADLMNALKVAAVLSGRVREVKMRVLESKKNIEISSGDQAVGENAYLLPAKVTGASITTTFNWRYVLDALNALETDEVFLGMNEENKPARIQSPNDISYFYIVMPILKT